MKMIKKLTFWLISIGIIALAALMAAEKFWDYLVNPWTRDGQVHANIIQIAPRVSGPVVKSSIKDNQFVHQGDLLFEIDPTTYINTLNLAEAALNVAKTREDEAASVLNRWSKIRHSDKGAVSTEKIVELRHAYKSAHAKVKEAEAKLEEARLDLEFTKIYAPAEGYITNLTLFEGYQADVGRPVLALVDSRSFWIYAFFRENNIANIKVGDKAVVTLMTYPSQPLEASVQSVGWGIARENGSMGNYLLPNVEPTFEWIRLAQRIPVRIVLKKPPPDNIELRVGATASVIVYTDVNDTDKVFSSNLLDLNPFNY